jgi:L-serine dehydratase
MEKSSSFRDSISILNNVLGPVMRGPSSSHAAAPFAIANIARSLSTSNSETITLAEVRFDPAGSFAQVYSNQGSDEGFAAGLFGVDIFSPLYLDALDRLHNRQNPFKLTFNIVKLENNVHPNAVEIKLRCLCKDNSVRHDLYSATSTGGGMFVINSLNNAAIEFAGQTACVILHGPAAPFEKMQRFLNEKGILLSEKRISTDCLFCHTRRILDENELIDCKNKLDKKALVRQTQASQLAVIKPDKGLSSVKDITSRITSKNKLHILPEEFEGTLLEKPQKEIQNLFLQRMDIMLKGAVTGIRLRQDQNKMKYLAQTAPKMHKSKKLAFVGGKTLHEGVTAALAVMEQCSSRGVVCAAPTAGSAGILPGVLFSLQQEGMPDKKLVNVLKIMGLVGLIIAKRATFAAECCGCAAETGSAAAMAAGGIAYAHGGSIEDIFNAASICIMNTLGLVCDPVGGEVEIPCHSRNISGIGHAYTAALSALGGFNSVIPFDEIVDSLVLVGKSMHTDFLCTARGGLAVTPTACRLKKLDNPFPKPCGKVFSTTAH